METSFGILLSWVILSVQSETGMSCNLELTFFSDLVQCKVKETWAQGSPAYHIYKRKTRVFFIYEGCK